jgi:hypothetical protein
VQQVSRSLEVSEHFERAVAHALKPLTERVTALEARNAQLEKDLFALRRAAAALVQQRG